MIIQQMWNKQEMLT